MTPGPMPLMAECVSLANAAVGSLADISGLAQHVRFTRHPKADMCGAMSNVRLAPMADVTRVYEYTPFCNGPGAVKSPE